MPPASPAEEIDQDIPDFQPSNITYIPAPVCVSVKTISPTLNGIATEGFHNPQFNGEYHTVAGCRVQKKGTFWRRPNLDVFMHSYPYIEDGAFLAVSLRNEFDKANGTDHEPQAFQLDESKVWMEVVRLNEVKSISVKGFEKEDLNDEYTVKGNQLVQGSPVLWNGKRTFFIYFQALYRSRPAIASKGDYDDAKTGDLPAYAFVLSGKGWQEHDGVDWQTRRSIITNVKWKLEAV